MPCVYRSVHMHEQADAIVSFAACCPQPGLSVVLGPNLKCEGVCYWSSDGHLSRVLHSWRGLQARVHRCKIRYLILNLNRLLQMRPCMMGCLSTCFILPVTSNVATILVTCLIARALFRSTSSCSRLLLPVNSKSRHQRKSCCRAARGNWRQLRHRLATVAGDLLFG